MSSIYVTSDLHFRHENIIKYEKRPFTNVDDINESLVKRWNSIVGKSDKVFVLGDVSFCGKDETKKLISRLNGYKALLMGNHDTSHSCRWYADVGFDSVSKYSIIYDDWIIMSHKPPEYISEDSLYFYIYGHVHGTDTYSTVCKQSTCACVERWGYRPVLLEDIVEKRNDIIEEEK